MDNKRIIIFDGAGRHPALHSIVCGIKEGFSSLNENVYYCDCKKMDDLCSALDFIDRGEVKFCLGLYDMGMEWDIAEEGRFFIYDKYDIPHVSVMLDMPYNKCISGYDIKYEKHIITVLDYAAIDYLRYAYPDKAERVLFLPLAGMAAEGEYDIFSADKKYDVAYMACPWMYNLYREGIERPWHSNGTHQYIVSIFDDVADYLEVTAENVWPALKLVLREKGFEGEGYLRQMMPYCWDLLLYIKTWRRIKGLEMLVKNDIKVDVFGSGWESVPFADKLILHGDVSYEESLQVYAQSKILFQDAGEFNHGANDRTFNAMLNGAVLVTEYSKYLDDNFVNGQDLFMYDWQDGENQVKVIHELLVDDCRRLAVAVNAYGKASRFHTWRNRAQTILEAVHLLYDRDR